MRKSGFYTCIILSLVFILSAITKLSFAESPSPGETELKAADLPEEGVIGKNFDFILNAPFGSMKQFEGNSLYLKIADDRKTDLYDIDRSISLTLHLLQDMTPDMLSRLGIYKRTAFIINLYNVIVLRQYIYNSVYKDKKTGGYPFRPSLEMIGTKTPPETIYDEFFFKDPFYTATVFKVSDNAGNKIPLSLNDISRGIIMFEESYISGIDDETKVKAMFEYHNILAGSFYNAPELLLLLTCDTPVLTMLRDFPSNERAIKAEDVTLVAKLAEKIKKFASDKKRGKITYETYSRLDGSSDDNLPRGDNYLAGADLGIFFRNLYLDKKGPIKKLKSMRLPYFYKLYEGLLFQERPVGWNLSIAMLSKDERLKTFLKTNPKAEYEIRFNTNPRLLWPR